MPRRGGGDSSPRSFFVLGAVFIGFAAIALLLLSLGHDPHVGRTGSWALIGIPLGIVSIVIGFRQKRKRDRTNGADERDPSE